MDTSDRHQWLPPALLIAAGYVVVGVATAYLARSAPSSAWRALWRRAAWALSLVLFTGQLLHERLRLRTKVAPAALHAALAAAVGALALAALGPVRAHWGAPARGRVALLSLVLWPILTGVPAFVAGIAVGWAIRRRAAGSKPAP